MTSAGSQQYEDGDVELREFAGPDDEAEHIAQRILELLGVEFVDRPGEQARGLSFADMAVLVRVKKLIPAIVDELERREIPYVVGGVSSLFDTAEASAARELFYFLAGEDGSGEAQLRAAWSDANLGLSDDDLDRGLAVAVRDRADHRDGRRAVRRLQPPALVPVVPDGDRAARGEDRRAPRARTPTRARRSSTTTSASSPRSSPTSSRSTSRATRSRSTRRSPGSSVSRLPTSIPRAGWRRATSRPTRSRSSRSTRPRACSGPSSSYRA